MDLDPFGDPIEPPYDEDEDEEWEGERDFDEEYMRDHRPDDEDEFADPGGESALRAESPTNPRNLPCRTCGRPNRLTPADVRRGYQCDTCADRAERGWDC